MRHLYQLPEHTSGIMTTDINDVAGDSPARLHHGYIKVAFPVTVEVTALMSNKRHFTRRSRLPS
jgi:hypothetical protein